MQYNISIFDNTNFLIDSEENDFSKKHIQQDKFFNEFINNNIDVNLPRNSFDLFFIKKDLGDISLNKNSFIKSEINHEKINEYKNEKHFVNKFIIKKENKIFNIRKETKLGRPKNNSFQKRKHDKFQRDNIIRKFKAQFVQNLFDYINLSFKKNQDNLIGNKKPINIIQKINACETKSISKESNIRWLNSKIKDIFSHKISSKFVSFEPN